MDSEDEEVFAIRDLTNNQSLFNLFSLSSTYGYVEGKTCGTLASKDKQANLPQASDPLINGAKRLLANGNYEYANGIDVGRNHS